MTDYVDRPVGGLTTESIGKMVRVIQDESEVAGRLTAIQHRTDRTEVVFLGGDRPNISGFSWTELTIGRWSLEVEILSSAMVWVEV